MSNVKIDYDDEFPAVHASESRIKMDGTTISTYFTLIQDEQDVHRLNMCEMHRTRVGRESECTINLTLNTHTLKLLIAELRMYAKSVK